MKKFKYLIYALMSGAFLPLALQAQPCNPPLSDPNPYIISNPSVIIEPYLARALSLDGLNDEPLSASALADMDMAVQLKAALLLRAGGLWGSELKYAGNELINYKNSLRATVDAINQRYDCAGLRRPLIQASVFTEEVSAVISNVLIEPRVIQAFSNEISAENQYSSYYDVVSYGPLLTKNFNFEEVISQHGKNNDGSPNDHGFPDVTKLQGRMWIYQQSLYYLDAGYTSLHMGQVNIYSTLKQDTKTNNYSVEYKLSLLDGVMKRIRDYAAALPNGRSFYPILMAEGGKFDGSTNIKYVNGQTNGVDNLIFDCNTAAARPRETYPREDAPRLSGPGCPASVTNFANTPCDGKPYMATIDACHGGNMLPDGGGVTPSGRVFADGATAYTVYLDFGTDDIHDASDYKRIVPHGEFTPSWNGTWGYDDARWYTQELLPPCRGTWMKMQLESVRTFINSKSFFQATGRVNGDGAGARLNTRGAIIEPYRLQQDAATLQAIQEAWQVKEAKPRYEIQRDGAYTGKSCTLPNDASGSTGPAVLYPSDPTSRVRCTNLLMTVTAPDVTSIYTWHIQRPDNSWEPMTYGSTRTFSPTAPGTYHVTLKQDNLGLSDGNTAKTYPTYDYAATCDCQATQASARAATPLATANQLIQEMQLEVSPLPTTGRALVQFTSSTPLTLSGVVSDLVGRRVLTVSPQVYKAAGTHSLELNLETLATGVYNCQLTLNGTTRNVKLVKN